MDADVPLTNGADADGEVDAASMVTASVGIDGVVAVGGVFVAQPKNRLGLSNAQSIFGAWRAVSLDLQEMPIKA